MNNGATHTNPMTDSAAPEYEIRTVADFAKVPEDRLAQCLSEFAGWVRLIRDASTVNGLMSTMLGTPAEFMQDGFHWVDDGIVGMSAVNIHDKATGELFTTIKLPGDKA